MRCAAVLAVAVLAAAAVARVDVALVESVRAQTTLWEASLDSIAVGFDDSKLFKLDIDRDRNLGLKAHPLRLFAAHELRAPDSFDSRKQWPTCSIMNQIRDQSKCGSCWAFGAVSSMSDRECIVNKRNVALSAEDMNSCSNCGGCGGGYTFCAFSYWKSKGVVSEKCAPYSLLPCKPNATDNPCPQNKSYDTPKCPTECVKGSGLVFANDKYKANKTYSVSGEKAFMAELSANGPFEVSFTVYEDFKLYLSGIYHHVNGSSLGGHAVKLVGYGEENGVKYWTLANSWGTKWGEGGFFRIRRGTNECRLEGAAYAGNPVPIK